MVRKFKEHLSFLCRNGLITLWDYEDIKPGAEWDQETEKRLDDAQLILLFISRSFINSHYCYTIEMQRAIQRHEHKQASVIPILLRPFYWKEPPLDKLQVLPNCEKCISRWRPQDEGYTNAVEGILKVVKQWDTHTLADPTAERSVLIAHFDQLSEVVKIHMQPPPRAIATVGTLQELSIFVPNDVTLADLIVGWQTLSHVSQQEEEPKIAKRRVTCGELAHLASQFTTDQGSLAQAVKTWHIWRDAFTNRNDPRQRAMTETFAREFAELQAALLRA